jgi:two-component system LytT family response regulator
VKAIANSVEEAVSMVLLHKPNVLFLDIQMPTGSGFEVIEQTSQMQYKVIFTTAHEEYALQAIKANAIDYLLKPIIADELVKAVTKVVNSDEQRLTQLLSMIGKMNSKPKISIPCSEGLLFVEVDEIIRLEADSNYTYIFLSEGKKITASKTMKDMEKLLPDNFLRVHTTHVINIDKVEKYIKGDGGYVLLEDGKTIPVSRSQKQAFLKKLT